MLVYILCDSKNQMVRRPITGTIVWSDNKDSFRYMPEDVGSYVRILDTAKVIKLIEIIQKWMTLFPKKEAVNKAYDVEYMVTFIQFLEDINGTL